MRTISDYTHSQANRLKSATIGVVTSTYVYDGDGKRSSKTAGGVTTSYLYDLNRQLSVVLEDGTRKYVWGLGLAFSVGITGTAQVYYGDGLGSVRALADASGQVLQTYWSDEFGVATSTQGPSAQPFGYTGEQRDSESGFLYLRSRMYDPQTGRFLGKDAWPGIMDAPGTGHTSRGSCRRHYCRRWSEPADCPGRQSDISYQSMNLQGMERGMPRRELEDALNAYRWLVSELVDPARLAVLGISAGGGLAMALLVALRDAGDPLPAAAVCLSPQTDHAATGGSVVTKKAVDPWFVPDQFHWLSAMYLAGADPRTPLASPLYADLTGLPPLLVQVGTAEMLLEDSTRLAGRARSAGVDVTLEVWEDMIHGWQMFARMLAEGQQAIEHIGDFIRKHLASGGPCMNEL